MVLFHPNSVEKEKTVQQILKFAFKTVMAILLLAVLAAAAVIVAVNVSPRPVAWMTNYMFSGGVGEVPVNLSIYQELSSKVKAEKEIEYPSKYGSNRLDVFSPKDASGRLPTILWVHGGGFVGGDKSDIDTWAKLIAGQGYTVVSINYALAPETNYPGPIVQTGEAYSFLAQNAQRFPTVDLKRLVIGGDSAGTQITSQFIAVQTNPDLAKAMQMQAVVPKESLKGAILYCGPYDLKGLFDAEKWFGRFFGRQMGWSYFGIRDWKDSEQATQATTTEHVTPAYPPTFITDGNTASFEPDARKLEAKLKEKGVAVDSLYYSVEQVTLPHEYQFDFSKPQALECYTRTLAFLSNVMGSS